MVVGGVEEAAGRIARSAPARGPSTLERSRTSARRRSPRRAPAGHRRGACSPRARPARPPGRPSTTGRASRRVASSPPTIAAAARSAAAAVAGGRVRDRSPRARRPHPRRPRSPARSRPRAPCRRAPAAAARPAGRAGGARGVGEPGGDLVAGDAEPLGQRRVGGDPRQDRHALPVAVVGDAVGRLEQRAPPRRAPRRISGARQVNVRPSMPSVSASWLAAKAPSSVVSSRSM